MHRSRGAGKVAKWIGGKAHAAADEFAKTVHKVAGVAVVGGIVVWLVLQGKLAVLVDTLEPPCEEMPGCLDWRVD